MKTVETVVLFVVGAAIAFIVFVRAGQQTGVSGGTQTAQILDGAGNGLGTLAADIETGGMYGSGVNQGSKKKG